MPPPIIPCLSWQCAEVVVWGLSGAQSCYYYWELLCQGAFAPVTNQEMRLPFLLPDLNTPRWCSAAPHPQAQAVRLESSSGNALGACLEAKRGRVGESSSGVPSNGGLSLVRSV